MKVIDVLDSVKMEEIAENLIRNHNSNFNNFDKTMAVLKRFFEDISSITLQDISETEYKDFTVIVNEYYDDNSFKGENIFDVAERYREKDFDFSSVTEDTLEKYFVVDAIHLNELKAKKDNLISDYQEYLKIDKDFEKHYVTSYGIDFMPRSTILACEVADLSIQKFGLAICATEIFWELTFYGLTEEQVQAEAESVFSRANDVENEEELKEEDFKCDVDSFEIDIRDTNFSIAFSKKVCEYDYNIVFDFYKEMAKTI